MTKKTLYCVICSKYSNYRNFEKRDIQCFIMHFILPKIQNKSNVKGVLLQWFVHFLIKNNLW